MPFPRCFVLVSLFLISISLVVSSSTEDDHSRATLLAYGRSSRWKSAERERFAIAEEKLNLAETTTLLPSPPVWPEVFHASIIQFRNGTSSVVDLYYDWKKGRNANLIRKQLESDVLSDVEYNNKTSFYFTRSRPGKSCRKVEFPVGILPPDWLAGARYLGERSINGFDCHGWAKGEGRPQDEDFVHYWARVEDQVPVRWTFHVGEPMEMNVYSFEVGKELPDSEWQAPSWCF